MPVRFCFVSIQPSNWAPDFSARPAAFSLCAPTPANPCDFVSGSKIFTFPPPDFTLPRARRPPLFAPLSPLGLVPPSRGAKSSHSRRRISPLRAPGGLLSLLPAPREPLCLRLGEQNLHIPAAGFRSSTRPADSFLCSPLPARPCASVSGSKIFTFPPPDFSLLRDRRPPLFAPRSPLGLVPPFRGAKSSHSRRRFSPFCAPGGLSIIPMAPLPTTKEKHRAAQLLLGAFLSSFSIIPIPLLPPAQS